MLYKDKSDCLKSIASWANELGFSQIGITTTNLDQYKTEFSQWLHDGFYGDMHYMARHVHERMHPASLVPGTISILTARMNYLPMDTKDEWKKIEWNRHLRPDCGVVSIYARGRDYHKVLRQRLLRLAHKIQTELGERFGFRVFTDSAPILEVALATNSGLGWRGKHTLLLNRDVGSMFFLGEIYIDRELPTTDPMEPHCGTCQACIDICPTQAIVAPYVLDARRCISYLTIEHQGAIPIELRPLMDNRIYGCDDCQLICPWNKFAQRSTLSDFSARSQWLDKDLCQLFLWSEDEFLKFTEGSPIRRIGHERWLRNIAVALGNAKRSGCQVDGALMHRATHSSPLIQEHITWALEQCPD